MAADLACREPVGLVTKGVFCQVDLGRMCATGEVAGRVEAEQLPRSAPHRLLDAFSGWRSPGPERG